MKSPPSFVPVDTTEPPLLSAMHAANDPEAPDLFNRIPWWYSKVEPWFEWANTEGPCTNFVTFDDPNPVYVNVWGRSGRKYQGYIDENREACGQGTYY